MKTIIIVVLLSIMSFSTFAQDTSRVTFTRADTFKGSAVSYYVSVNDEVKGPIKRGESVTFIVERNVPLVVNYSTQKNNDGIGKIIIASRDKHPEREAVVFVATEDMHLFNMTPKFSYIKFNQVF